MAMLYASNNVVDYNGGPSHNTDGASFDSAKVSNSLKFSDNLSYTQVTPHPESSTTVTWYHFRKYGAFSGAYDTGYLLDWRDASGNLIGRVDLTSTYRAQVLGDSTVFGSDAASNPSTTSTWNVKFTVDASNITMEIYVSGTLTTSATVSNTTAGYGKPVRMDFVFNDAMGGLTGSGATDSYSEIMASEDDLRNIRLNMFTPVAAGNHTDFSGAVSELSDRDDETGMFTKVAGDRQSNTIGTVNAALNIHAVVMVARGVREGSSPTKLNQGMRISAVDYDHADDTAVGLGLGSTTHIFAVSPATAVDFTPTELSAAEMMMKSVA